MTFVSKYRELPRNTRVNLWLLLPWAIPYNLVASYGSMFMLNMGMTSTQIGTINAVAFIFKAVLSLFCGFVTNKLGRHVAMGLGDIVGTGFAMLILCFANSYEMFMLAYLIWALSSMTGIACNCYYVEDVPREKRLFAHNLHYAIHAGCTLVAPIASFLIDRQSFLPAMKGMYLFAGTVICICGLLKIFVLGETSVGAELKKKTFGESNPVTRFVPVMKYMLKNRSLLVIFGVYLLFNFATQINTQYYYPFLQEQLGFSETAISYFTVITTFVKFGGYLFLVSHIHNMEKWLFASIFLFAAGSLILIGANFTFTGLAFICPILWALASTIMSPVITTLTANSIANDMRTDVQGYMNTVSMLFLSAVSSIAGRLFDISPIAVMSAIFVLYIVGGILYWSFSKSSTAAERI